MPGSQGSTDSRYSALKELLTHEKSLMLARVREYRAAQEEEALEPPGDELDAARALSEVETHASLIERTEERLRDLDLALGLLEQGNYGICVKCRQEIPLERLKAVPFATHCVNCQQKRNGLRHVGEGTIDEPFAAKWDLPEEMAESTETSRDEFIKLPEEGPGEEEPSMGGLELGAGPGRKGRRPHATPKSRPVKPGRAG